MTIERSLIHITYRTHFDPPCTVLMAVEGRRRKYGVRTTLQLVYTQGLNFDLRKALLHSRLVRLDSGEQLSLQLLINIRFIFRSSTHAHFANAPYRHGDIASPIEHPQALKLSTDHRTAIHHSHPSPSISTLDSQVAATLRCSAAYPTGRRWFS
jgi:hypothetical protein